jgi:hypothetical protein
LFYFCRLVFLWVHVAPRFSFCDLCCCFLFFGILVRSMLLLVLVSVLYVVLFLSSGILVGPCCSSF